MPTIDADAHIIETTHTWERVADINEHFLPKIVEQIYGGNVFSNEGDVRTDYWMIDNKTHSKDRNLGKDTCQESRELRDVDARLRHMDELEIDIQVLYPTLFLRPVTQNLEVEYALCYSYNRYMADIWKQSQNRLRWTVLPPMLSPMPKIREEFEFAKEYGACGIFVRGLECERQLTDSYFYPLYETAGELDLPICDHAGSNSFIIHDFYNTVGSNKFNSGESFNKFKLVTVGACHAMILDALPAKFPKVRWGILEASSQWIPYILNDLQLRFDRQGRDFPAKGEVLKENNIWVACQFTDDLDIVVPSAGEGQLMIGTDYGHHDTATNIHAIRNLKQEAKIASHIIDKILDENARTFYGI